MMSDWQPAFEDFFDLPCDKSIIELGCGDGTHFLLKNFSRVTSIEYTSFDYIFDPPKSLNYRFIEIQPIKNIYKIDRQFIQDGVVTEKIKKESEKIVDELEKHESDILFIDFGAHFRGLVLQQVIQKRFDFEYIALHDTNYSYYKYDLEKIDGYKITYSSNAGSGTKILQK
jgi:hypothetical protein